MSALHSSAMDVAALAGGVGGAKLLVGLAALDIDLTAIVNTGDDAVIHGVHVSPDVDIVSYWLSGIADTERGWGIKDDTFDVVDALERLGAEAWFRLGDRDLATCMYRTQRLAQGAPLSQVTSEIGDALGIGATVLPMTDDEVRTKIVTTDERVLGFQEYFVKERHEPDVAEVRFTGIADALPAPGVLEALRRADVVVVCPSNPLVSIDPILALPGVRDAVREHPRVVAVSPIVGGRALKGPADRMMQSAGIEVSAAGVASHYRGLIDEIVIDEVDEVQALDIEPLGVSARVAATVMHDTAASRILAETIL